RGSAPVRPSRGGRRRAERRRAASRAVEPWAPCIESVQRDGKRASPPETRAGTFRASIRLRRNVSAKELKAVQSIASYCRSRYAVGGGAAGRAERTTAW